MEVKEFINRLNLVYGTEEDPIARRIELAINSRCASSIFEIALVTSSGTTRKFITDLRNLIIGNEGYNTDIVFDLVNYTIEHLDLPKNKLARVIRNVRHLQTVTTDDNDLEIDEETANTMLIIFRALPDQDFVSDILKHHAGYSDISLYNVWKMYLELVDVGNAVLDWEMFKLAKKADEVHDVINVEDFFSIGQIKSKLWAIDKVNELGIQTKDTIVHASWAGLYPYFMYLRNDRELSNMLCVDIDDKIKDAAYELNRVNHKNKKFGFLAEDSITFEYKDAYQIAENEELRINLQDGFTVVNTSCEHIEDFDTWYGNIPDGTIVILQSNNFDDPGHIGGDYHMDTLEEFVVSVPLTTTYYTGELDLVKYSRFMIIGVK